MMLCIVLNTGIGVQSGIHSQDIRRSLTTNFSDLDERCGPEMMITGNSANCYVRNRLVFEWERRTPIEADNGLELNRGCNARIVMTDDVVKS